MNVFLARPKGARRSARGRSQPPRASVEGSNLWASVLETAAECSHHFATAGRKSTTRIPGHPKSRSPRGRVQGHGLPQTGNPLPCCRPNSHSHAPCTTRLGSSRAAAAGAAVTPDSYTGHTTCTHPARASPRPRLFILRLLSLKRTWAPTLGRPSGSAKHRRCSHPTKESSPTAGA